MSPASITLAGLEFTSHARFTPHWGYVGRTQRDQARPGGGLASLGQAAATGSEG